MSHADIEYDRWGRMKYHPEFHSRQGEDWTTTEQKFLVENYEQLGPEEVSLALERTIFSIIQRAYKLRKLGEMPMPKKPMYHRRVTSRSLRNAGT